VAAVAGVAIYLDRVAPFRAAVVTVDDRSVSMRTFLRRMYLSGQDPLVMLQVLANEEIVKLAAPAAPYSIRVTDQDVDDFLHGVARGEADSIAEGEYRAWYRLQLNESRMPDPEFRDLVRTNLLMSRLTEYLRERVPTVAEQVHLHMIPIDGLAVSREARRRIEAGERFALVAREVSADAGLGATGGDMGWQARDGLEPPVARLAFDELAVGEISEPYYVDGNIFRLIMVSERSAARQLDERTRLTIQDRVLDTWLDEEQDRHTVDFHGITGGGYGSETDTWVRWQLERMQKPRR
jgi:parvulin-like peptidyl-prolyl isomerase